MRESQYHSLFDYFIVIFSNFQCYLLRVFQGFVQISASFPLWYKHKVRRYHMPVKPANLSMFPRKMFTVGKPDSVPLKGCIHLSHDACAKFRHTPCPCGCDEPEVFGRATRLPISSCTGLGLSCREHRCSCGELLPRRFTLTRLRGRFVFCDTCRPSFDARPSLARGILLCGVWTFLSVLRSECIDREQLY